jgi:hypothetical protein
MNDVIDGPLPSPQKRRDTVDGGLTRGGSAASLAPSRLFGSRWLTAKPFQPLLSARHLSPVVDASPFFFKRLGSEMF